MTDALLVLTTLPNADAAAELAKSVVTEKLAAYQRDFTVREMKTWADQVKASGLPLQ